MGPTIFWLVVAIGEVFGVLSIIQVIIFAVVSIISLVLGYSVLKKKYKNMHKRTPLREEAYIARL